MFALEIITRDRHKNSGQFLQPPTNIKDRSQDYEVTLDISKIVYIDRINNLKAWRKGERRWSPDNVTSS